MKEQHYSPNHVWFQISGSQGTLQSSLRREETAEYAAILRKPSHHRQCSPHMPAVLRENCFPSQFGHVERFDGLLYFVYCSAMRKIYTLKNIIQNCMPHRKRSANAPTILLSLYTRTIISTNQCQKMLIFKAIYQGIKVVQF